MTRHPDTTITDDLRARNLTPSRGTARALRVLFVEDSDADAALLLRELRRGGLAPDWERVDTEPAMRAALDRGPWDIVLSDYCMPRFSAPAALEVLRSVSRDVPFVIVSGVMGEDTAVEAMRKGVNDYIIKDKLWRLVPAVERELQDAARQRQQRALEARLHETQVQLEQIVTSVPDVFWSARFDRGRAVFTFVSPSCLAVLGSSPETLQEQPDLWWDLIEPQDRLAAQEAMLRAFATGKGATSAYRARVGAELRCIENTLAPYVEHGVVKAVHGVARDVTARRTMEQQLMLADRMVSVGTLAAGVAHEINNPLAVVLAGLDFACEALDTPADGEADRAETREALRDAREGAQRVRSIVRDLKLFSRADDERRGPVDVRAVLDSSIRMSWNEIRHRARLVRCYGDVPPVEANEARLGQVFLNLLVNAAQAIEDGHVDVNEITVSTLLHASGHVAIDVRDTGCGMPPEVRDRIFDPFFTTKPVGVGTGLGLAICHRIVTSFGGEIEIASQVGRGTTFRVLLPRAPERPSSRAPAMIIAPRSHRRGRILVIDDEVTIGVAIRRALGRQHDVETTTRATEALQWIAERERFDVILCDLVMPEMTGMELYDELRRVAPDVVDRVIFMTGGAFTQRARAFFDSVPNQRIEKPFDMRSLQAAIGERLP